MKIKGSTVLVTGASSGIGAAIARGMARAGGRLLLLARRGDLLDRVAEEITKGGGQARSYAVDLSDAAAVERVAARINQDVGAPDIIVNNAGAGQWKFVDETSPAEAVQMMALPYFAAFYVTHSFLPAMLRRNSGHIVNISSVASRFVWPGATAYTAARWAVRGFTEALRADLHGTGVRVTLLECGVVRTPYWETNPGSRERVPRMGQLVPVLAPEEVAAAVVKGVERNKRLIVIPFMMKLVYLQHALFPRIVQGLMTATGYRRDRT